MRYFVLLLALAIMSACDPGSDTPEFIPEFAQRARDADCSPLLQLSARGSIVEDVALVSDSILVVLYSDERRLVLYDQTFDTVGSFAIERSGPTGVTTPVSAAGHQDSLLFIADAGARQIKRFSITGEDRGRIPLDFMPRRIRNAGTSLVITPLVVADHPSSLAFVADSVRVRSANVPTVRYDDGVTHSLANLASVATFPDGRVIVAHELIVPFGYSLSAAGTAIFGRRWPIPLPEAMKDRLGRLPRPPIREHHVGQFVPVALSMTSDPETGALYYLTSNGRPAGNRWDKAIVRLDSQLRFEHAYRLTVNGFHIAYFPARRALLVVDSEQQWFECRTR